MLGGHFLALEPRVVPTALPDSKSAVSVTHWTVRTTPLFDSQL